MKVHVNVRLYTFCSQETFGMNRMLTETNELMKLVVLFILVYILCGVFNCVMPPTMNRW